MNTFTAQNLFTILVRHRWIITIFLWGLAGATMFYIKNQDFNQIQLQKTIDQIKRVSNPGLIEEPNSISKEYSTVLLQNSNPVYWSNFNIQIPNNTKHLQVYKENNFWYLYLNLSAEKKVIYHLGEDNGEYSNLEKKENTFSPNSFIGSLPLTIDNKTFGFIKFNNHIPFWLQGLLLFIYFIAIFSLLISLNIQINNYIKTEMVIPKWKILGILGVPLVIIVLNNALGLNKFFSKINLFNEFILTSFGKIYPGFLLIDLILFLFILIIINKIAEHNESYKKPKLWKGIIALISISLMFLSTFILVGVIIGTSNLSYSTSFLILPTKLGFLTLAVIALDIVILFFVSSKLSFIAHKNISSSISRTIIIICSSLIILPFIKIGNGSMILLLAIIFMILIDIFTGEKEPNIYWLNSWVAILGIMAGILIYYHSDIRHQNICKEYSNILSESEDKKAIESLKVLNEEITKSNIPSTNLIPLIDSITKQNQYLNKFYLTEIKLVDEKNENYLKKTKDFPETYTLNIPLDNGKTIEIQAKTNPSLNPIELEYRGLKNLKQYEWFVSNYGKIQYGSPSDAFLSEIKSHGLFESSKKTFSTKKFYGISKKEANNRTVYIGYQRMGLTQIITVFALIFPVLVGLILLLALINSISPMLPIFIPLRFSGIHNLRTRFYSILMGIVGLISILGVGITLQFEKNRNENIKTNYTRLKTNEILEKSYTEKRYEFSDNTLIESLSKITTFDSLKNISKKIEVVLGTKPIFFDHNGLALTNESELKRIPWNVWDTFNKSKKNYQLFEKDKNQEYVFVNVENEPTNSSLYLGFQIKKDESLSGLISDNPSEKSILYGAFVLLVLIAGFSALLISEPWIHDLKIVSEKVSMLQLEGKNEIIQYSKKNELGDLVSVLNSKIQELQSNAETLKQVERERTWRDVARLVAHEINNPLTSIRMDIQRLLLKSEKGDLQGAMNLALKSGNTWIDQIDNISGLANRFSAFAKIPEMVISNQDANILISNIVHLFHHENANVKVEVILPSSPTWIQTDKNQFVSAMNNLIKNAIQSIPSNQNGLVMVQIIQRGEFCEIRVSDNGSGIKEENVDKIFLPNFTTKNTGNGIGLAYCKKIIEDCKGRIRFETKIGEGTTFFIEMPTIFPEFLEKTKELKLQA
jgi:signal transduction histidine kinase